jgi:long-chain acyl-CoA synthetase
MANLACRRPAGVRPAPPLYHIFAFTVNMMLGMRTGGKT